MKTEERCPICGSRGTVTSVGAFGFTAFCYDCYEPDDDADEWRRVRGHGPTEHQAVELWLEAAREIATNDELPDLTISYRPTTLVTDILAQAIAEFALQSDYDLVPGWRWVPDSTNQDGRRAEDVMIVEFPG
jgi:hypothetical protein